MIVIMKNVPESIVIRGAAAVIRICARFIAYMANKVVQRWGIVSKVVSVMRFYVLLIRHISFVCENLGRERGNEKTVYFVKHSMLRGVAEC